VKSKLYIVFRLNEEEYGIEIAYAQEILRMPDHLTHLPNMPAYVEGVINIRGKVIPVIDLKKRFDLKTIEESTERRLIILNFNNTLLAVVIDDVSEIVNIEEDTIQNVNSIISQLGQNCLAGIGRIEQRLILLLDVLKLNTEIFAYQFEMEEIK
jgi:purine-binding chemotaxis protein CheW